MNDNERPVPPKGLGDAIRSSVADSVAEARAGVAQGAEGLAETLGGLGGEIRAAVEEATREVVGPSALRGLAHPLRVKILDLLGTHGPLTASGLGELLGESSGSTSYHLRQLAKHGFVREVEGKGTARERWWERMPGGFTIDALENRDDPATRMATDMVNAEFERARQEKVWAYLRSADQTAEGWEHTGVLATQNLRITAEQLTKIVAAWEDFSREHLEPLHDQRDVPGARPVQVHFNAFPVIDPAEGTR
ncbi:helix-turn-helix domain-containing protein [Antribacter sp. KLBMP9083]|uniref:Helix-turn-helix domain-containing protein n=1 Tax=Antribacter soli TaxID=2910976 RepID=A0AA41QDB5_9MICO|nr:helix-turn-helix domain-containing protein [Antribacter soli]MCF4120027.1 helix-turn-helix domain-containing protein [Antribacter soli]